MAPSQNLTKGHSYPFHLEKKNVLYVVYRLEVFHSICIHRQNLSKVLQACVWAEGRSKNQNHINYLLQKVEKDLKCRNRHKCSTICWVSTVCVSRSKIEIFKRRQRKNINLFVSLKLNWMQLFCTEVGKKKKKKCVIYLIFASFISLPETTLSNGSRTTVCNKIIPFSTIFSSSHLWVGPTQVHKKH